MKKYGFLFLIMVAAFALLLSGCTQTTPSDKAADEGGAVTTTAPLPTEPLDGTGGDENACTVHQFYYHSIDGDLIEYVGQAKMNEFIAAYEGKGEECNIMAFVRYCGLTREDLIQAFGWENTLDQPADSHAYVNWFHQTAPYTRGEFLDAIFGDDATLTERIFSAEIID